MIRVSLGKNADPEHVSWMSDGCESRCVRFSHDSSVVYFDLPCGVPGDS
jgi:hypothetical protein